MKVKEVLREYHKKVLFPLTVSKIKKAGYPMSEYLTNLIEDLRKCEDFQKHEKLAKNLLKCLEDLKGGTKDERKNRTRN